MNEMLEKIAWAIFESWFVDFDPVRAKAAGCDPGLPKHITADLFPDSFVEVYKAVFGARATGITTKSSLHHHHPLYIRAGIFGLQVDEVHACGGVGCFPY